MKYKGKLSVSFELLKQLLNLDEGEDIVHITMTEDDIQRDTFSIIIQAKTQTKHTHELIEGCVIPKVVI